MSMTPTPEPRPHGDVAFTQRFSGERLRARRGELHLTRTAVASGAQLPVKAVKAMERNRIRPSDQAFAQLCKVLKLTDADGRARLMVPGPADHRPTEYASQSTADLPERPRRAGNLLSGLARQRRRGGDR